MRHDSFAPTAPPQSRRSTSVPEFDLATLAANGFFPRQKPLDVTVPAPVRGGWAEGVDLRSACVLMHANGRSSVRDIAQQICLSVEEVVDRVVQLAAAGLVTI